jgi:quercetin dioxygenase-like cupin family protein
MKCRLATFCLLALIAYGQLPSPKVLVLERNEGEKRVRLPREGVANKPVEFILKVTPESSGSQHLVLGTQTIPPGGTVPKHRHLDQDEIVVLQTGVARVMLGDKDYDIHAGGIVFAPANTWMSLENTGTEDIQLIFIYSAPGFERYMRCTSTPVGQTASPLSLDQLRACAEAGHVEYQAYRALRRNDVTISDSLNPDLACWILSFPGSTLRLLRVWPQE